MAITIVVSAASWRNMKMRNYLWREYCSLTNHAAEKKGIQSFLFWIHNLMWTQLFYLGFYLFINTT